MKYSRIYFTGFMGSGKSTLGRIVANTLGWDFFDIDTEIEKAESSSIKEIFSQRGEEGFRRAETEMLKNLSGKYNAIIALGGGTLINEENLRIVKSTGYLIYLKVTSGIIYERLSHKTNRPLLLDEKGLLIPKEEVIKRIEELFSKRESGYLEADRVFEQNRVPVGIFADNLIKFIKKVVH